MGPLNCTLLKWFTPQRYIYFRLVFDFEHGINEWKQYNTYYAFNQNKNCIISFCLNTVDLNPTDIWDHVDLGDLNVRLS